MGRISILIYALICYVIFLVTFLYAIAFVGNLGVPRSVDSGTPGPVATAIVVDLVLLGLFAVQHTVMARPRFKAWWTQFVPKPMERATFVLFTSLVLILLFRFWEPIGGVVWNLSGGIWQTVMWVLFALGWAIVLLATFMIDHFELFGVSQAVRHFKGDEQPALHFKEPGLYKVVRHPIMLGFIIAFWAIPVMSMGHLLFAAATTAYIFIGIAFEERDLLASLGNSYADYRKRVPMIIPFLGGRKDRS